MLSSFVKMNGWGKTFLRSLMVTSLSSNYDRWKAYHPVSFAEHQLTRSSLPPFQVGVNTSLYRRATEFQRGQGVSTRAGKSETEAKAHIRSLSDPLLHQPWVRQPHCMPGPGLPPSTVLAHLEPAASSETGRLLLGHFSRPVDRSVSQHSLGGLPPEVCNPRKIPTAHCSGPFSGGPDWDSPWTPSVDTAGSSRVCGGSLGTR